MSQIPQKLWDEYLRDIPIPPGCTYEQFYAAREEMWRLKDRSDSNVYIGKLLKIQKRVDDLDIRQQIEELIATEIRRTQ